MKHWVKILFVFLFFSLIFLPKNIFAHPGNTASDGCHYCRTNCDSWGVPWNERHCHGGYSGASKYQAPPSCPSMSSYNSISGQCECYSGYVASGNSCISTDQACKNKYGYNSQSDYSGKCECRYGYTWNSSGTSCIDEDQACQNQFGYNSKATLSGDKCECKYGYAWNSAGTKCVSQDEVCQSEFGHNSKATISGDKCECKYGYTWNKANNKCITKDSACQELNGLMSRSNLSGECECLSGYEYDGFECVSVVKKNIITPKPTIVKKEIIKIPTPTIASSDISPIPDLESSLPKLDSDIQINPISNFFSRLFSWFFD